jgi:Ion channel
MHVSNAYLIGMTGMAVVLYVCFDVFQSVIMPRITLKKWRIAPALVGKILWPITRAALRPLSPQTRTGWLEMFAPAAFIMLLSTWLLLMIFGFALLMLSLGDAISPPITEFPQALYFAGTSVLTLGFGDLIAKDWTARLVVLVAAVLGLIFMALVVSLLFSMQSNFQHREQVVNTLMSRAGVPASGVVLLLRYRELNIVPALSGSFTHWEIWVASILESHRAYPLLCFFRSSSTSNSWLATIGATMDAASLLLTAIDKESIGEADLYYWTGALALKGIVDNLLLQHSETVDKLERAQFQAALDILKDAGYSVKNDDRAWKYFQLRRRGYIGYLTTLADWLEMPINVWMPNLMMMSNSESGTDCVPV